MPQAIAQDVANLVIAPALITCAVLAMRGSLRSYLVWLGFVAFTFYNYVIYVFAVPFGPLFPLWTIVLSLSLFALIGGLVAIDASIVAGAYQRRGVVVFAAWFLLVVATLFALIWLSEDVPALLAGTAPQSTIDMAIPTNPVHILDYVFFLPAAVIVGIGLLRQRGAAFAHAPGFLVFLALTCAPILITPFVSEPIVVALPMMPIIGALALALVIIGGLLLRSIKPLPLL